MKCSQPGYAKAWAKEGSPKKCPDRIVLAPDSSLTTLEPKHHCLSYFSGPQCL